jgi:hypothetical protein
MKQLAASISVGPHRAQQHSQSAGTVGPSQLGLDLKGVYGQMVVKICATVSLLAFGAVFLFVAACGEAAPSSATGQTGIGNVNCSTDAGPATGLTKFGATIGAWNATHVRDAQYLSWGPLLPDGERTYPTVRCSTDGRVIVIQVHMNPPVAAATAVGLALAELPADVKMVYDVTQAQCRNLQYQSQALASEMGADNPDGIADIQLESPLPSAGLGLTFQPDSVETAHIDLLDAYSVKPTGC